MEQPVKYLANHGGGDQDGETQTVLVVPNASRFTEANFSHPIRTVVFKDKEGGALMHVVVPDDWKAGVTKEQIANAEHEHFFTYCMEKIAPGADVDDPQAFCAWLKGKVQMGNANERLDFVGNSVEFKHGADGWVQLSPYGRFAHSSGDQLFTYEDAAKMVEQFNAASNLPQRALGVPWYIGHPDHPNFENEFQDKRAYGRIKRMEARSDGLWANVRWSGDGKKLIEDQAFHGHSVNWGVVKKDGFWRPVALKSVGFTNEPNIPVLPVTAANERTKKMDKTKLCKQLGLDPATVTDEQIDTALANAVASGQQWKTKFDEGEQKIIVLKNEKKAVEDQFSSRTTELTNERTTSKTALDAEKVRVTEKETQFANERKAHVKSALDMAISGGFITIADRAKWEAEFANSHDAALTKLLALKPTINVLSNVNRRDQRGGADGTVKGRMVQFNANVRKRMEGGLDYNSAWNAEARENPQLLEAQASVA